MSFYIMLNSAAGVGDSYDYTTTLANTINLNDNLNYEIAVIKGSYQTPDPHSNKNVYFLCDLVEMSYVGNTLKNVIHKTNQQQPTKIQADIVHFENSQKVWFKMNSKHFSTIRIQVQDEDATNIPSGYSDVLLEIRQII